MVYPNIKKQRERTRERAWARGRKRHAFITVMDICQTQGLWAKCYLLPHFIHSLETCKKKIYWEYSTQPFHTEPVISRNHSINRQHSTSATVFCTKANITSQSTKMLLKMNTYLLHLVRVDTSVQKWFRNRFVLIQFWDRGLKRVLSAYST